MTTAVLLGVLQGAAEWLPVSSEGLVAAAYSLLEGESLDEAVGYALWLHVGTMPAALVVLRRDVAALARELWESPREPSPLLLFIVVSTVLSMVVGLPLVLALGELSGLVGVLMLVTGTLQMRRAISGDRDRTRLVLPDALLAGVAQGLSVLPGFSRSGLTVAALLGRGVDKREALVISFPDEHTRERRSRPVRRAGRRGRCIRRNRNRCSSRLRSRPGGHQGAAGVRPAGEPRPVCGAGGPRNHGRCDVGALSA